MAALPDLADAPQLPTRVVGSPTAWARDFAVLGAGIPLVTWTSLLWWYGALGAFFGELAVPVTVVSVVGGVTGAALGATLAVFLDKVRGQVPLPLLGVLIAHLGAAWGLGIHAIGDLVVPRTIEGGLIAMLVAACVFGASWLPYAMASVFRRSTAPVVAGALALTVPASIATFAVGPALLRWLGF